MAKMNKERLGSIIQSEIRDSQNHFETEYSADRLKAIDYYLGEPFGNEIEGRSSVVTTDFADAVEQIMPSLMRIFTSSDKYVRYAPRTADDVEKAEQLTDYVNYIINNDNDGYRIMYNWFKDSLMFKLGVVKFSWDETSTVQEEEYEGLTEEEIALLLSNPDIEVVGREENYVATMTEFGEEIQIVDNYDLKVKITKKSGKIKIDNVPPEEFLFNRRAKSLEDCYFICHRTTMSVSDLVSMGYDRKLIEDHAGKIDSEVDEERQKRFEDLESQSGRDPADPSQKDVIVHDIIMKVDYDDDGVAEMRRILAIGDTGSEILENDICDYIPFAVISPILMPHRLVGRSMFDLTQDLQTIKSTLLRQYLDSTYHSVLPRIVAVEGQVNLDDLLDGTAGGIIRTRSAGAVQPLSTNGVGAEIQPLMNYLDEVKSDRTGISKASQGLDPSILQSTTASAVSATVKGSQQKLESYARTIAETGVKDLFRGILHLVSSYQQQERVVRLRNEFVAIDPQEGNSGFDVIVNVGLGTADDEQKIAFLQAIASKQETILQTLGADNPICDLSQYVHTLRQITEIGGFKDANQFFKTPQAVQMQMQQQKAQKEGQPQQNPVMQAEMMKAQAEIEARKMKIEADIELARQKAIADIQLAREKMNAELEMRRQELGMEAELRMAKAVTDAEISTNLPRA
jgi:hypothetical protein|tara:strand:+ start:955 stop:3006 length:2052 start_codon:yes stop_codon:yes gene_type:complete